MTEGALVVKIGHAEGSEEEHEDENGTDHAGHTAQSPGAFQSGSSHDASSASIASVRAQRQGVLRALKALANFGSDRDPVRLRVAVAMRELSRAPLMAQMMLLEGTIPVLVQFCSSMTEQVRQEAIASLFNLSLVPGSESRLVSSGAVEALLTVAIVRTHDEGSQAMGIEALQNIMADPESRM